MAVLPESIPADERMSPDLSALSRPMVEQRTISDAAGRC